MHSSGVTPSVCPSPLRSRSCRTCGRDTRRRERRWPSWLLGAVSNPEGLELTVQELNRNASVGQVSARPGVPAGVSAFNRSSGDPEHQPNPSLAPAGMGLSTQSNWCREVSRLPSCGRTRMRGCWIPPANPSTGHMPPEVTSERDGRPLPVSQAVSTSARRRRSGTSPGAPWPAPSNTKTWSPSRRRRLTRGSSRTGSVRQWGTCADHLRHSRWMR